MHGVFPLSSYVKSEALVRRRNRTHAIVEGALLGDIAIVFLLMRVYLPLPVVRTLLRTLAVVPFVMLTQRRGIWLTILSAVAAYILFSALVGPILALSAVDIGVAGILVGVGRRLGIGPALNTLWTGPVYAVLDLIIPTIVTVIVFQYPVDKLAKAAKNFVRILGNLVYAVFHRLGASSDVLHQVNLAKAATADHWVLAWVALMILYGLLTMYLVVLIAEMVLRQIPEETLAHQEAA
jgi:hypothetical protein